MVQATHVCEYPPLRVFSFAHFFSLTVSKPRRTNSLKIYSCIGLASDENKFLSGEKFRPQQQRTLLKISKFLKESFSLEKNCEKKNQVAMLQDVKAPLNARIKVGLGPSDFGSF